MLDELRVSSKIIDHLKGKKIRVAKFKSKVRHRRIRGHRQSLSQVSIVSIGKASSVKKEEKKVSATKTKEVTK